MIFAISLEDIIDHFIPVSPGKINIEIRWGSPVWIQETFKIEIQFNGIHIGDLQTKSYDGIGAASSSHMVKSTILGITDDIPGNEKIGIESHLIDDGEFFVDPGFSDAMILPLSFFQPVISKFLD
jgi:hypothetical protein